MRADDWRCPVCGFGPDAQLSHLTCVREAMALFQEIGGDRPLYRIQITRRRERYPWVEKLFPPATDPSTR
jgi:hypothetical protein